ncbi:hypothetical protein [Lysobacter sp. F6437]|uniref:hypothetical protein n=1 Tax=Lysobacter sp. F6437 TaxID=3459296 RepID=UPI00403D6011
MDIVWIEDKIALVQEDLEYCLKNFGLDLDLDIDTDLLTAPFWVAYYSELAEIDSLTFDEDGFQHAQSRANKLFSMLPPALASTIQMPLATAINAADQARFFLNKGRTDVALEWLISATKAGGLVMGIVGAGNSDELSAETQRSIRRDAAILGHAKNHEAKAQAIELYRNGSWPSKDQAAGEIAKRVNKAFRTVRGWLNGV